MKDEILLKVAKAIPSDVGHGRARIPFNNDLGVTPGDIIEIIGTKSTAAIVWRCRPEDNDKDIIRIDGIIRKNAGTSIGDRVRVRKATVSPAVKLVISPVMQKNQRVQFGPGIEGFAKRGLMKRPVTKGDKVFIPGMTLFSEALPFGVVSTTPKGIVQVVPETETTVREEPLTEGELLSSHVTYEDIGGLSNELQKVREMIELPLKHQELFDRLGIEPPKGVLLHGSPGTGKTLIAKAVANESGANFISIQGPEIISKFYGESEKQLRSIFEEAETNAPSIIFIDELDSIAPKREDAHGEVERRVVAQLLTLMDGLKTRNKVIVIGATNRINAIDQALRRPGRFDREIEIGVPDREGRREILDVHSRGMPLKEDYDPSFIVEASYGFVGADIAALCREAAMKALRRYLPEIDLDKPIPSEILEKMHVEMDDFRDAIKDIEPSALREVFLEIPKINWNDVGGLDEVKLKLRESIEWPLTHPEKFDKLGIRPPRGILLFGPPGTGKTLLAKAIANEAKANFISVKGPEVLSKWVGESEKAIREIFKKAKQASPAIIFLDEIDSIAPRRGLNNDSRVTERMVNQLLTSMDGIELFDDVIVIAATNRAELLDPALIRSGRFDNILSVGIPDVKTCEEILKIHTAEMPLKGVKIKELAKLMEGYVGADIESVCREAAMLALREDFETDTVEKRHFVDAMKTVRPSVDAATKDYFAKVEKDLRGGLTKPKSSWGPEHM